MKASQQAVCHGLPSSTNLHNSIADVCKKALSARKKEEEERDDGGAQLFFALPIILC